MTITPVNPNDALEAQAPKPDIPLHELTAETINTEVYYSPDEWDQIPDEAHHEYIQALTDRAFAEEVLQDTIDSIMPTADGVSDLQRLEAIEELLRIMLDPEEPKAPLMMISQRPNWLTVPQKLIRELETERWASPTPTVVEAKRRKTATATKQSPMLTYAVIAGLLVVACVATFLINSLMSGPHLSKADATATAVAQIAAQTQMAGTPSQTTTPTPLALEDIDRPIGEGDNLTSRYPTILEIRPLGNPNNRVFPVQQREVDIAEWNYASDPDVASSILGMVVRPVLGIPYSEANQTFLETLVPGDQITLRMNTGQALLFIVRDQQRVGREDDSIFNQQEPGIVIVLLADPAPTRLIIYGDYVATQEVADAGTLGTGSPASVAAGQPAALGDGSITLTVSETYSSGGPAAMPLSSDWTYLLVDVVIATQNDLNTGDMIFTLHDNTGVAYSPSTMDPTITHAAPFVSGILPAGQTITSTLGFLVPKNTQNPTLAVQARSADMPIRYALDYAAPSTLTAQNLDILVLSSRTEGTTGKPGDLVISVRLFNPASEAITVLGNDVYVIYSPTVLENHTFPIGNATTATSGNLPLTLKAGESIDIELRFPWNGDPYVGIKIGGYEYVAVLR